MNIVIAPRALAWIRESGAQLTLDPVGGGG